MAVIVGSARSDERGKATGGKAGDQKNGREVSTQEWYAHGKGWRVLRCIIPEARPYIAEGMQKACDNNAIGYDQYQRLTLHENVKPFNFDPAKTTKAVETDCSALARDCILYALRKIGRNTDIANFITSNEASVLLATGLFEELKGDKYTEDDDFLMAGDLLVTRSKGHTVVCITSGSKAGIKPEETKRVLGSRILRNGMKGSDVVELQELLIKLADYTGNEDFEVGHWGADGDFGDNTEMAVRAFQKAYKCAVDGEVGPETLAALNEAFNAQGDEGENVPDAMKVRIEGGQCYVRSAPNTGGKILGVAKKNSVHSYQGVKSENGWLLIEFEKQNGWVSGKYGRLEG